MTRRSKLKDETVLAVAEIASRLDSPFKAREALREVANKHNEWHYAVRAAYRIERRKIEEGST